MPGARVAFVLRAVRATAGRAAAPGLTALLIATLLTAAVPFSRNGLDPRDVVAWLDGSLLARATTLAAWVSLVDPITRALLAGPGTRWLRTTPSPLATVVPMLATIALAAQLPMFALYAQAGGLARGVAIAALGAGTSCAWVVGRPLVAHGVALLALAMLVPTRALAPLHALAATACTLDAIRVAWLHGPAEAGAPRGRARGGGATRALIRAAWRAIARDGARPVPRALALAAFTLLLLTTLARNAPISEDVGGAATTRTLAVLAIPVVTTVAWLAAPLRAHLASLATMAAWTGTSMRALRATAAAPLMAFAAAFGALAGATHGTRAALLGCAWGASLAALVGPRVHEAEASRATLRRALWAMAALTAAVTVGSLAVVASAALASVRLARAEERP